MIYQTSLSFYFSLRLICKWVWTSLDIYYFFLEIKPCHNDQRTLVNILYENCFIVWVYIQYICFYLVYKKKNKRKTRMWVWVIYIHLNKLMSVTPLSPRNECYFLTMYTIVDMSLTVFFLFFLWYLYMSWEWTLGRKKCEDCHLFVYCWLTMCNCMIHKRNKSIIESMKTIDINLRNPF